MFRKTKAVDETRPVFHFPWVWHVTINVTNERTCCDGIRMVTFRDSGETNTYIAFSLNWGYFFHEVNAAKSETDHVLYFITCSSFAGCRDFLHASWRCRRKFRYGTWSLIFEGLKVSLCFCIATLAMFQWYFPSIVYIVYFPKMVK